MLGFILSKMNMMIFAAAIFVIALMMLSFTDSIELKNITSSNLNLNAQIIEEQLNTDSICSYKSISIPDTLNFGLNNSKRLFYDLKFSKVILGDQTALILSINEHGKQNIIDARRIVTGSEVILVDPGFIATDEKILPYFDKDLIDLYPRLGLIGEQVVAPNAFVALKNTELGNTSMYIIPCSTAKKEIPNNCQANILRVGCFELQKEKTTPLDTDKISECFDISREILQTSQRVSGFTWADCKNYYGAQMGLS